MLHWARSYFVVGLLAAAFTLFPPLQAAALLLIALFAALALLALVVGALGRNRDGSYSAERALGIVAFAGAAFWLGHEWIANGWTAADAGRAVDQTLTQLAETRPAPR
jgi:hypothetical protein